MRSAAESTVANEDRPWAYERIGFGQSDTIERCQATLSLFRLLGSYGLHSGTTGRASSVLADVDDPGRHNRAELRVTKLEAHAAPNEAHLQH